MYRVSYWELSFCKPHSANITDDQIEDQDSWLSSADQVMLQSTDQTALKHDKRIETLKKLTSSFVCSSVFVCLFVCLFVPLLLPDPWTDFHQTWYVCVGWPQNCPWGVRFGKGQGRWGRRSNSHISQVLGLVSTKLGMRVYAYRGIVIEGFVSAKVIGVKGQIRISFRSLDRFSPNLARVCRLALELSLKGSSRGQIWQTSRSLRVKGQNLKQFWPYLHQPFHTYVGGFQTCEVKFGKGQDKIIKMAWKLHMLYLSTLALIVFVPTGTIA
jgi:hypothetical protein